eukprot:1160256-Pelagomonas_calceolata.AAC.14
MKKQLQSWLLVSKWIRLQGNTRRCVSGLSVAQNIEIALAAWLLENRWKGGKAALQTEAMVATRAPH